MTAILGTGEHRYRVVEDWAKLPEGWELKDVAAVAVDSKNRVYVFNRGEHPMIVFDSDGNFLSSWGEGRFPHAHGLHIDANDILYCTDDGGHFVRKCTTEGKVLLELGVLVIMFLFLRNISWTWILALPILVGMALFAQGVGLVLSIINARFGDVMYIVAVALGALYFLTPVLYPISMVDGQNELLSLVVKLNPVSWYVEGMHDAMYSLVAPSAPVVVGLLVGGILTFWAGFAIFNRWSEDIGEML
jgi:hypothetical protein